MTRTSLHTAPRRFAARVPRSFPLVILLSALVDAEAAGAADAASRLAAIEGRLPAFRQQICALRAKGQDTSYPTVSYTVLENFVPLVHEDLAGTAPDAFGFLAVNGANAKYEVVGDAHSGRNAAKLTSASPLQPNVYGMLEGTQAATLKEGQPYTLSAWVKTDDAGAATLVAGGAWHFVLAVPDTGGEWKRIEMTFTPGPSDLAFVPRVIVNSETDGVLVDDVALVEGSTAESGKNLVPNGDFEASWTHRRAARELDEMEDIVARLDAQLRQASADAVELPKVPRWTGKQRPRVEGSSFVGPVSYPTEPNVPPVERPIFFVGYGHFAQARNDIEKFPAYGINVIQGGEWGPEQIYPAEGTFDDAHVRNTLDALDRGARHGVAYDWLISPHYVPAWWFEKYPHIRKARTDFFPYSVFAPEPRRMLREYLAHVVPMLKDKPALLSVCLTNEPINREEPSEFSQKAWQAWLAKRHGDVATINRKWRTSYQRIDDIPQPHPLDTNQPVKYPSPEWADFARFNAEFFAEFHKELADAVKAIAPDLPVHAKGTTWHLWRALPHTLSGLDPALMGAVTDVNGNDSVNLYGFGPPAPKHAPVERGSSQFANGWIENQLSYDLQRSTRDAPVFNSENHLVFDRETRPVPARHFYSALWQGAAFGQSATTLWVWERTTDPRHDFAGNVMDRPACAEAVGHVNLDLNRVAREVTAIQKIAPAVQILHSPTAAVWDGAAYEDALVKTYTALSFTGNKIGFITERQLEQGKLPAAKVVFVPNVTHLSDEAFAALQRYDGQLVFVGNGGLQKNEYDAPRDQMPSRPAEVITFEAGKTWWTDLWQPIVEKLPMWGVTPAAQAIDVDDGKVSGGVQTLTAETDVGQIMNLFNASVSVRTITLKCEERLAVDLLSGRRWRVGEPLELQPMETRLFRLEK